jgi:hypothetical protein
MIGCSIPGEGEGEVTSGALYAQDCWYGGFDLGPDFFAANPYRDTMQIRVQRGRDLQEVSDGVAVLISEVSSIRPTKCTLDSDCASDSCVDGTCASPDRRGLALDVGLSPQILNELAPGVAPATPPPVSMALYLQNSCHGKNVVLYAMSGTITFSALFNGDPNEKSGAEKFTDATFSVIVADPRDAPPGTLDVPAEKTSPLDGWFRFHFQRGQPGQPFP